MLAGHGEPLQQREVLLDGLEAALQVGALLVEERALVVLSTYAIGCSPLALENLLASFGPGDLEAGELALREEGDGGRLLPAGFCARWWRGFEAPLAPELAAP